MRGDPYSPTHRPIAPAPDRVTRRLIAPDRVRSRANAAEPLRRMTGLPRPVQPPPARRQRTPSFTRPPPELPSRGQTLTHPDEGRQPGGEGTDRVVGRKRADRRRRHRHQDDRQDQHRTASDPVTGPPNSATPTGRKKSADANEAYRFDSPSTAPPPSGVKNRAATTVAKTVVDPESVPLDEVAHRPREQGPVGRRRAGPGRARMRTFRLPGGENPPTAGNRKTGLGSRAVDCQSPSTRQVGGRMRRPRAVRRHPTRQ